MLLRRRSQPRCRLLFQLLLRRRSRRSITAEVAQQQGQPQVWRHLSQREVHQLFSSLELHPLLLRRLRHSQSHERQFREVGSTCLRALSSGRTNLRRTNRPGQHLALER